MKTNIGPIDRLVRGLAAVLIAITVYLGAITGVSKDNTAGAGSRVNGHGAHSLLPPVRAL